MCVWSPKPGVGSSSLSSRARKKINEKRRSITIRGAAFFCQNNLSTFFHFKISGGLHCSKADASYVMEQDCGCIRLCVVVCVCCSCFKDQNNFGIRTRNKNIIVCNRLLGSEVRTIAAALRLLAVSP